MSDADPEFATVAAWTVEILDELPTLDAIPGACRGSGEPAALQWLAQALEIGQNSRVLDLGGGIGGPAAWLHQRHGCLPVVADPEAVALRGARRLFGLPGVAVRDRLPFPESSFDAAWTLATLSTIDDQALAIAELHRVLIPGGHLGLLEYVRAGGAVVDPPAGNRFFASAGLADALADADFEVLGTLDVATLDPPPHAWQERGSEVKQRLTERHGGEEALAHSEAQERRFAHLLANGSLVVQALHARRP